MSATSHVRPADGGMHRELRLVDAAAFSVGLIGPVGAIALLGTGAAGIIGRGVTLSFIFAVIGVALVGYAFVRLSQHIAHTGSVYALVGVTLGPRAGFFAGWALLGAYTAIGCGSTIEIGLFAAQFLRDAGIANVNEYVWLALLGLGIVCALAFNEIRVITRTLLASEVTGVILVTILSLVTLARLIFGHGPQGQTFNLHFLQLPAGAGIGTVASAAVYGFLAFAGFEGAAALGEETDNPKVEIPRAIRVAVIVVGAFVLVAFLLTGQYMDYLDVRSGALGDATRMMFRSRHIYVLLAGLVNLAVGTYFVRRAGGWRRTLQTVGSVLVLAAPFLLLAAFFTEPGQPGLRRQFTLPAIIILAVGTLLHAFSGARAGRKVDELKQERIEVELTD
jgi:amino acid transporter